MAKYKIGYCAGHSKNTPGKRTPNGKKNGYLTIK